MKPRKEHLAWAKERALNELESSGPHAAVASMLSDFTLHDELLKFASSTLGQNLFMVGRAKAELGTVADVKKWIEGFD